MIFMTPIPPIISPTEEITIIASATLTMRDFSDDFLEGYLAEEGAQALDTVGCYRLEGPGAQLFAKIQGDYFAILGLPLLPLLAYLRERGLMPS